MTWTAAYTKQCGDCGKQLTQQEFVPFGDIVTCGRCARIRYKEQDQNMHADPFRRECDFYERERN